MNTLLATSSSFTIASTTLLEQIPVLLAWLVGIVLAVLMVRWGGGKAEKLLLAGCSLIFTHNLATPLLSELVRWLGSERGMSNIATAQTMGLVRSLPLFIFGLSGFVCLVLAFWMRFKTGKRGIT